VSDERAPDDSSPVPSGIELPPLDPTFRTDPYPVLARLRQREPVHHDALIHRWVLTRPAHIERVLRGRRMSVAPRKAQRGACMRIDERSPDFSMLLQDPPDCTRLRALVSKAYTPRAVERLAPASAPSSGLDVSPDQRGHPIRPRLRPVR
jgi:cytochrome P450